MHECRLETGGALTFIEKHPTDEDSRHHEIVGLLAQIEARQCAFANQLAALERKTREIV